jgi:membrane protein involved in colicin uptake
MRPLLAFTLTFAIAGAQAQTMFKCVDAQGKTSYADRPCASPAATKKEIDMSAAIAMAERERKKKADELERERALELEMQRNPDMYDSMRASKLEKKRKLTQGTELERRQAAVDQMKEETAQRVKADEAERLKASALWKCKRGPEPEKCQ